MATYWGSIGIWVERAAAIVAVGAGLYMLGTSSADSNSIFNPLLHGIGAYILARGAWMFRHAGLQADVVDRLDQLVELGAIEHSRTTATEQPAAQDATS
jgi:hypothetical protein